MILRLWWIVTFLLSAVSFASAVQTVMTKWPHLARWQHADIVVAFVTFPVTVFLFILALVRSTGILTDNEHDSQNNNGFLDPLLSQQDSELAAAHKVPSLSLSSPNPKLLLECLP